MSELIPTAFNKSLIYASTLIVSLGVEWIVLSFMSSLGAPFCSLGAPLVPSLLAMANAV